MGKLTKIDIITRPSKLEPLKDALAAIGVAGLTVSQVYGCGRQKGYSEVYRGNQYDINLLPKVKVEIVVCEIPAAEVVKVAKTVCRTGQVGDGKIFIYPLANAVRIRTGEEGATAI